MSPEAFTYSYVNFTERIFIPARKIFGAVTLKIFFTGTA